MDARYIGFGDLVQLVSNHLFDVNASAASGDGGGDVRANLGSCLDTLPRLNVGLDVNCRFGGPREFEYTSELAVFDLCDINLFHGWVVSKQDETAYKAFGSLSYNQVVEKLIVYEEEQQKSSGAAPSEATRLLLEEGQAIKEFMQRTASQLSYEGLLELHEVVRERELAVFFRNSHFSAMLKYSGKLYMLCTDIAFGASDIVWERLDQLDGDTAYCDADFKEHVELPPDLGGMTSAEAAEESAIAAAAAGDDEAALRIEQGAMDEMIAWQMQQEEQIQAETAMMQQVQALSQAQAGAAPPPAAPATSARAAPGNSAPPSGSAAQQAPVAAATAGARAPKEKKKGKSCVVQ